MNNLTENIITPFSRPVYVMAKPVGAFCNLACRYCYYLEKKDLYPEEKRHMMSEQTLERYIRLYIEAQTSPHVQFVWHGGEATVRSVDFYRKAMLLQQQYGRGMHIENCLQTNGTLLTDEWCRFLHDNNWLVGLSIDGPEEFHDEYRRDKAGKPTFLKTMRAVSLLNKHHVEWNAMAVVNDYNADYPQEFYRFFKKIGCRYIQFTPIVERVAPDGRLAPVTARDKNMRLSEMTVSPQQWGDFLCGVFDEWIKEDVGRVFVQLFDATLANWVGVQPGVCSMARTCGHAAAMEWNGDVYSCDHFVFPQYKLGNIYDSTFVDMMGSDRQLRFGSDKHDTLPDECLRCEYLSACNGECPKNRFMQSVDGQPGKNYLCAGYKKFFKHVAPYMDFMAEELKAERPPSNVMKFFAGK
ncbi:MAG: anaerobic sulfatase-maturation protein [Muribaculaceae bacterium]|nr:anaerobic sulfatase-maturation protein [Muribaculaceae bacterium]